MSQKALEVVKGAVKEVTASLVEQLKTQEVELKELRATRDETAASIAALETKYEQCIADLKGEVEELIKKGNRLGQDASHRVKEFKTAGRSFVESDEYKEFKTSNFRGTSKRATIPSTFELKELTGTDSLRNVLSIERVLEIIRNPVRMQRIRDLFPVFQTQFGSIEYVRETLSSTVNTSASPQVHGDLKAETLIDFEDKNVTVRTIAHWVPVNNQLLSDVNALRGFIDTRLVEGLKLKEDVQILYGSGADPDLNGILTDPDIQTFLWSSGAVGDSKLDAIRRSITKAQLAEFPVDAIILNPQDWETMELTKGTDSHYVWFAPSFVESGGQPRLWRVPVLTTTAIQPGDALIGAFGMGAAIWDREDAAIRVTDSHADFFIRNKTVILAEERLAVTVFRPQAFVYLQFDSPPTS